MLTLLVLKFVATIVTTHPTELDPGVGFSAAAADRLAAGWNIGVVDVLDDGTELHLELTLVDGERAERLVLSFDADGETPLAFARKPAELPAETRIYRTRGDLAMVLGGGEVTTLYAECGSYFLEGQGGGASVDPFDYYVVAKSAKGADARRVLARILAAALEDDMSLTGVLPVAGGVDLVLFNGSEEIVHTEVDEHGRVTAVELRWSPSAYQSWETRYTNESALVRALRKGRTVEAVSFEEGGARAEPTLTLQLADGEFVVDMADFAIDEDDMEDFGCGC